MLPGSSRGAWVPGINPKCDRFDLHTINFYRTWAQATINVDADALDVPPQSQEQQEDSTDNAHPLMFLYDCETTGLSIYNDHIIELAAEVMDCPVPHTNLSFSSLVKTSRRIPLPGNFINHHPTHLALPIIVMRVTNITPTMVRGERPLSVVFQEFCDWLMTIISDVSRATSTTYYPGITYMSMNPFPSYYNLCPQFSSPTMVSHLTFQFFLLKLNVDHNI